MNTLMKHNNVIRKEAAFTKYDILGIVLAGVLLALGLIGVVNYHRRVSSRLTCSVNLKHFGLAAREFNDDNGGFLPWRIPVSRGGTLEYVVSGDKTYRHFQVFSNNILYTLGVVCPQDVRKPASNWNCMNNANVSYFVGLESDLKYPYFIMAGDRNISEASNNIMDVTKTTPMQWKKSVGNHGDNGYVVFSDGHVEKLSSTGLSNSFQKVAILTNKIALP